MSKKHRRFRKTPKVTPGSVFTPAAGAGSPQRGGIGMSNATQAPNGPTQYQIARPVQPPNFIADVDPGRNIYSPMQPVQPFGPPWITTPREWDYISGYNIDIAPAHVVFMQNLRLMAQSWGILATVIQTRIDQVMRMPWSIQLKDNPKKKNSRIDELNAFFAKPDGKTRWDRWCRLVLYEMLVTDATSIYTGWRRMDGKPYALEVIDGGTIKPYIDDAGRRPDWPSPAYSQLIKGLPLVNLTELELIYAPMRPRPQMPIYGYCYSSDTEVLTRRGWLRFSDVTLADEVASRNQATKAFEWQLPTAIIAKPHCGEMLHFTSTSVDILVTPEHRMLLNSMPYRANGGKKRATSKGIADKEVILPAKVVALGHNPMNKIPMTSEWLGGKEVDRKVFEIKARDVEAERVYAGSLRNITVPASSMQGKTVSLSGDDYCALMGAYLAEGNVRSAGGIEIAQKETSKGFAPYAALAARVLGGPAQHTGRAFVFARCGMTEHFRQFGLAHEKFIPDEIMNAPKHQIKLFWDYYVLGDGSFAVRKNVSGRGRVGQPGVRVTTVSERMAGQLVELAQKLGWSASVYKRVSKGKQWIVGNLCNVRDCYSVRVRYSKAMGFKIKPTPYEGTVHCVSVPNGIVYVRRNGKPAWCGNSPVEQIVTEIISGISRAQYQALFWKEGTMPEMIMTVPEGWNPQQLAQWQAMFDALMAGNQATKSRIRFVPDGMKPFDIKNANGEGLKADIDEWLTRIVCFAYSVSPTPFIRAVNRATAESAQEASEEEGLHPTLDWFRQEIMNPLIQEDIGFGYDDLEFKYQQEPDVNPLIQMQVITGFTKEGVLTRNEGRDQLGLEALEGGDELTVDTVNGPVPIAETIEANRQKALAVPDQLSAAHAAATTPPPAPPAKPPGVGKAATTFLGREVATAGGASAQHDQRCYCNDCLVVGGGAFSPKFAGRKAFAGYPVG